MHDIPTALGWSVTVIYRMSMNVNWYVAFANSQTTVLDQNWRNGSSWGLNFQYLW